VPSEQEVFFARHVGVLDRLMHGPSSFEPPLASPGVNHDVKLETEHGPFIAMTAASHMRGDINNACLSREVPPTELLSMARTGEINGQAALGGERVRELIERHPLLLVTLESVCADVLDVNARRGLIDRLRQRGLDLENSPRLTERERWVSLHRTLHDGAFGPSAAREVARDALFTQGRPPRTTPADPLSKRVLAAELETPHPAATIICDFLEANLDKVQRDVLEARARSVFCARFADDVPALELIEEQLGARLQSCRDKFRSEPSEVARRALVVVQMACQAAGSAKRYLRSTSAWTK
jgi:hypothetical protein